MKQETAITRVWALISTRKYVEADALMRKYRRKFGNRKFDYWMRLNILNGLWELECEMIQKYPSAYYCHIGTEHYMMCEGIRSRHVTKEEVIGLCKKYNAEHNLPNVTL